MLKCLSASSGKQMKIAWVWCRHNKDISVDKYRYVCNAVTTSIHWNIYNWAEPASNLSQVTMTTVCCLFSISTFKWNFGGKYTLNMGERRLDSHGIVILFTCCSSWEQSGTGCASGWPGYPQCPAGYWWFRLAAGQLPAPDQPVCWSYTAHPWHSAKTYGCPSGRANEIIDSMTNSSTQTAISQVKIVTILISDNFSILTLQVTYFHCSNIQKFLWRIGFL